jgi:hypothetical protein
VAINLAFAVQSAWTVSTTELSIISGTSTLQASTTPGMYVLMIDGVANMAKGDDFEARIYETVRASGTKRRITKIPISGVQSEIIETTPFLLGIGWDMTMIRLAGSDRAFDVSIRQIA